MPRVIVHRTEVMPDGGIRRVVPRPVIDFTCIEIKNSPISLWAQTWAGLVVKQREEELEKIQSKKED